MINDRGGVNGRMINLIQYHDAYSPPKTVERVRKLVEGDEVALCSRSSAPRRTRPRRNTSMPRRCRNCFRDRRIEIQRSCGLSVDDWLHSQLSGRGADLRAIHSEALSQRQIGVLYQNDDLGKDYLNGIRRASAPRRSRWWSRRPNTSCPSRPSF